MCPSKRQPKNKKRHSKNNRPRFSRNCVFLSILILSLVCFSFQFILFFAFLIFLGAFDLYLNFRGEIDSLLKKKKKDCDTYKGRANGPTQEIPVLTGFINRN